MILEQFNGINKSELSMIEVAHAILKKHGSVMEFNELLLAVQDYLELSENELEQKMSAFYTEINTDGSFISLGENRWGLRAWYPIDSIDEELVSTLDDTETPVRRKKRNKLNAFATSDDDLDYNNDDPEDEWNDEIDEIIDENDEDDEELIDYHNDLSNLDDDFDDKSSADEDLTIVSDDHLFDEI